MGSLITFELKKICAQRVMQISIIAIAALLAWNANFNITSQYALDPDVVGTDLLGTSAIAQQKMNADALAGPITDEAATDAIREWKTFMEGDEIADGYRWDGLNRDAGAKEYWDFYAPRASYLSLIVDPWMQGFEMPVSVASRIDTDTKLGLYDHVRQKIASELAGGSTLFSYSDAEQAFWMDKAESIVTPTEYGYAGGWLDFFDLFVFIAFALLIMPLACASVFSREYREKTDAVLLSTKFGRSRLGVAKVLASIIAASAIYLIMIAVLLGIPLIFFGADGAGLPMQLRDLCNICYLSLGAAALTICVVGYVVMLGLLGITLLLSSKMHSSMGVLAIIAAVLIIPMMTPNLHDNVANHLLFLFPFLALDANNFFDMISYSIGAVVIEYPVVLTMLYGLLFIVGSVLAVRSFNRHQVV